MASARDLFLERTYAEVTLAEIARHAGLTKGAIYHHFQSKEELYLALLHGDLEAKSRLFDEALETPGSSRERLGRLTRAFMELSPPDQRLIRLVRRDINVFNGEVREDLVRTYQRILPDKIERIVRDGIAAGEISGGDPRLLAWHFVALVEVVLVPYATEVLGQADAKLANVLDLFFDGVAPGSRSSRP